MSSGRLAIRTSGTRGDGTDHDGTDHNGTDHDGTGEPTDNANDVDRTSAAGVEASGLVPEFGDDLISESTGVDPAEIAVVTGLLPGAMSGAGAATAITTVVTDGAATNAEAGAAAASSQSDVSRETAPSATGATDGGSEAGELLPVPGATFAELPTDSIRPNTWQPRNVFDETELDELVASIREIGVLQPIVVRPDRSGDGTYELIMGERRWRATQLAGLDTVPAIIRDTDDADMLRDALLENLHRAQLNPLEEAAAYRQLLDDFGCTHEELATRIARSRPQISNTLRLLKLPPLVQRRVAAGILSAGHARALLGVADGAEIERLAQRIVSEGLSVRVTEEIVATMGSEGRNRPHREPRPGHRSQAVDDLAGRLSDLYDTRVKIQVGKTKGRVTVEFASVEDLNRILSVMAPKDPGLFKS